MYIESLLSAATKKKLNAIRSQGKRPEILLSVEGFETFHKASRSGLNHDAGLLEFTTRYFDLTRVHAEDTETELAIYAELSDLDHPEGFPVYLKSKASYLLKVTNKGKSEVIHFEERDEEGKLIFPESFLRKVSKSAVRLLEEFRYEYELRSLCEIEDQTKIPDWRKRNAFIEALMGGGWKVQFAMRYHARFQVTPSYVNKTASSVEIGFMTIREYHSLPRVLRFDFGVKLKTKKLESMGVEAQGWDGHHARFSIRKEQENLVKKFSKKFKV